MYTLIPILKVFVFSYTFIFGLHSAYVYTKTQSFISIIVLHAYCNFMQVPSIGQLVNALDDPDVMSMINHAIIYRDSILLCGWGTRVFVYNLLHFMIQYQHFIRFHKINMLRESSQLQLPNLNKSGILTKVMYICIQVESCISCAQISWKTIHSKR